MKKRTRDIIVDGSSYVYWYGFSDDCISIMISPKGRKTIKVSCKFPNTTEIPHHDSPWFWRMHVIRAEKEGKFEELKILMPGFASRIIQYLAHNYPGAFEGKNLVFENAYEILYEMGYENVEQIWSAGLW